MPRSVSESDKDLPRFGLLSALIAQSVEHLTFNQVVLGSSPSEGTNLQQDGEVVISSGS